MSNKVYCKGLLCRKYERKKQCCDCLRYVCKSCSIEKDRKVYCIDCYTKNQLPYSDIVNNDYFNENPKPNLCL